SSENRSLFSAKLHHPSRHSRAARAVGGRNRTAKAGWMPERTSAQPTARRASRRMRRLYPSCSSILATMDSGLPRHEAGATPGMTKCLRWGLVTTVLPCEIEILIVVAEIGIRIDLGHAQRTARLGGETQPRLGIAVKPVHEVLVADAHHFAGEFRGFFRCELHFVAARADMHFA